MGAQDDARIRLENPSKSLRLGALFFAFALTFTDDGLLEFAAEGIGEVVDLIVPVNLDCHLCSITNDVAVMAPMEMFFQFPLGGLVDRAIQIVG
jgi:hypothetical protein